jgi:hypothetical protein
MFEEPFAGEHLCWIISKAGFTGRFAQMLARNRTGGVRENPYLKSDEGFVRAHEKVLTFPLSNFLATNYETFFSFFQIDNLRIRLRNVVGPN